MAENKGGEDDGAWMAFLILAFIAIICYVIWYLFKYQLIQFVLWVREGELLILSAILGPDHLMDIPGYDTPKSLKDVMTLTKLDPKDVTLEFMRVMTYVTMYYWKWPLAAIMSAILMWCIFKGPTSLYRRNLGLEGLIYEQSKTFRSITPFVQFNPGKLQFRAPGSPVPAQLPLFAEALSPEEWIAYNRIPMPDGQLDEVATEKAFSKQLTGLWKGANKQKDYIKILLASFCLKANRKRGEADDMLGRLASCWSQEKGLQISKDRALLKEAKRILNNKKMSEKFHKHINKHAYITTACIAGLQLARNEGGVLAPAQFVWLRGYDRNLWYALNNLGRQAFHMEALGAMSHYRAEKLVERPIPRANMRDAVNAINALMNNPELRKPIPELDYSMVKDKKKNKGVLKPV
jgi:intracellular multiplication protein IcmP